MSIPDVVVDCPLAVHRGEGAVSTLVVRPPFERPYRVVLVLRRRFLFSGHLDLCPYWRWRFHVSLRLSRWSLYRRLFIRDHWRHRLFVGGIWLSKKITHQLNPFTAWQLKTNLGRSF